MDVSQIAQGEVKLKYHADKPLALLSGLNSFYYYLTLRYRNKSALDRISANVNVSFAFTHHYKIVGCDRGTPSLFDGEKNKQYCAIKPMGNGIGNVYECVYDGVRDGRQTGIHCEPDEELLPGNCDSAGYDLYSNRIMPFPGFIRSVTPYPILGFKVLGFEIRHNPASYACICVNERGYETSRIIVKYNPNKNYDYTVRRENDRLTSLPHILLPWSEAGLLGKGTRSTMSLALHHEPQQAIKIQVGTTLSLYRGLSPNALLANRLSKSITNVEDTPHTTWLPADPQEFYFTLHPTTNERDVMRKRYDDVITGTTGGFRVAYNDEVASGRVSPSTSLSTV
ncbi:hypothetical protein, conserved [Babesia ovata]|uniref:6-Cys domain-containing protein n=1 Tax=Babesia ovata TaxID=189622 RepID=A0A2H6KFR5_9APIC|nr:uncharacterized protein BOVATA_033170 [Babesia ovata]GBE61824.1 hypothetical protein, conserved [Babesia ovata]